MKCAYLKEVFLSDMSSQSMQTLPANSVILELTGIRQKEVNSAATSILEIQYNSTSSASLGRIPGVQALFGEGYFPGCTNASQYEESKHTWTQQMDARFLDDTEEELIYPHEVELTNEEILERIKRLEQQKQDEKVKYPLAPAANDADKQSCSSDDSTCEKTEEKTTQDAGQSDASTMPRIPSCETCGKLVQFDPPHGCLPPKNPEELRNSIVVMTRGHCSFHEKALQAISARASAMIVINNEGRPFPMEGQPQKPSLPIPAVMIGHEASKDMIQNLNQSVRIWQPTWESRVKQTLHLLYGMPIEYLSGTASEYCPGLSHEYTKDPQCSWSNLLRNEIPYKKNWGNKYAKRSEIEAKRLKRIREEEEEERRRKEELLKQKRRHVDAEDRPLQTSGGVTQEAFQCPPEILALSTEEVIRRLRLLQQPIRVFGETDDERYVRLAQAELSVEVADEAAGGQQENVHTALQRQEKEKGKGIVAEEGQIVRAEDNEEQPMSEEAKLMATFKAAAEALEEKNMCTEDIIDKRLKNWMADWHADLEKRLKNRTLDAQLLAGIKIITDAIKDRNYLHAYKIYMGVAIGNSPWPIGVTQVGLHERASREKISYKYAHGKAHIMNDEASRKFIQALKRIMTFCQRRYPTDPSRCVDFDGASNPIGDSSNDKLALLKAVARGDEIDRVEAPTIFTQDGAKIPEKWDAVIRDELKRINDK
eukprot:jgi/Picre1/30603/NNA_005964.t1